MNRFLVLCTVLGLLLVLGFVPGATYAQTLQQNAQNLDVGFSATGYTGVLMPDNTTLYSDSILPYFSTFSTAAGPSPSGNSICAAYVSADAGLMPSGAYGTIDDVGSRAWFEDWLTKLGVAQQTDPSICNRVLVIFKMFPAANRSAPANAAATTCGNPAGSVCNIGGAGNIAVPNNVAVTVDLPLLSWSTSANDGAPANPIGNNAQFQLFQAAFLGIDWQTITGWHGKFDFVPWNDFYSKTGDGDGLPGSTGTFSLDLTAQHAAAAYITLHLLCDSGTSGGDPYGVCGNVVAGSFLNNAMNCTDHTSSALASGTCADGTTAATLLDLYLWHIYNDAQQSNSTVMPPGSPAGFSVFLVPPENYPFDPAWTPEVFAFKDFADVNNYINNYGTDAGRCLDAATCVAKNAAQIIAADPLLQNAEIWNMAAAAGQVGVTTTKNLAVDPNGGDNTNWMFVLNSASDPTPDQQACAASYMLRLMASLGPQYKRLYYEGAAWDATITGTGPNGNWALFPAGDDGSDAAAAKPAFGVLTDRDLAYASTSGSDCPGGLATELANVSDTGNAGESIAAPGVFTNTLVARAKDIYGNAFGGASVTFSSSNGLLFSASATGTFSNTLTVTTDTTTGDTPPVYVEGSTAGTTYTATATLDQAPGATAAQFINLVVEEPSSSSTSALTVNGSSTSASVKYGDTVTLESTVTPAPPAGETTDTVTFWLGAVGSGTNLGTQTVDATGKAQLDITSLHVLASPYTIVARFNGSASLGASTSDNSVTVTVRQLTLNDDGVTPVLTATPDPAIRFADQLDSAAWAGYTFTPVSGADFVNGDDSSTVVVTGSPVYTSSDPNTQTPGTYTVTLSGISSPDYLIGFDTGSLDVIASAAGLQENADSLIIGFTGPIANTLPFADQFYTATSAYLTSKGLTAPRFRICEAYVAWDAALYASGAYGDVNTLNSRAWFENWLHGQQGHCDRALITFKSVSAATPSPDTPPTAAE
ncbi:MAG: Ig-like domain repeat protein, partial [Acidobacteriaceae bacterium]|nr:Ig-like domain repeat protein [Acidobacteriaceae bacterium]